jgi:hypothetical protein
MPVKIKNCILDTGRMKRSQTGAHAANRCEDWQKASCANLICYVPSGIYYAHLREKGKLIRTSLKTDGCRSESCDWAILKKQERQRSESGGSAAHGRMTMGNGLPVKWSRPELTAVRQIPPALRLLV